MSLTVPVSDWIRKRTGHLTIDSVFGDQASGKATYGIVICLLAVNASLISLTPVSDCSWQLLIGNEGVGGMLQAS